VSPILGIIASQNYVRIPPTSYDSIATTTVGAGGTSTVTFSSIPSTYKHLQIRAIARCGANGGKADDIVLTFNSDTGANYTQHLLVGNGSTAASYSATGQNFIKGVAYAAGQTASANIFGTGIVDVLDYTDTNKNTTVRALAGLELNEANTFAQIQLWSGLWINTAAVTSIEIKSNVSSTISQYSQFALYGIRG
jgi:hypothetical protein